MTNWNKYNNSLAINSYYDKINEQFLNFLETLPKNVDGEPFWEINDGEIKPISSTYLTPQEYIEVYIAIIKWLKIQHLNVKSGYAFVYQNENDANDTSVGGINSNNEEVTLCNLDSNGSITHESFKL